MEISFAAEHDRAAVRALWDICFGDPATYTDVFFRHLYKPERTVVAKKDDTIIGSLQLFPHTVCRGGRKLRGMYIGGVDVLPQYRRQGVAGRMMAFAESYMIKMGVELAFLVPVTAAVYRGMGYTGLSWLSEISGPKEALAPFALTDKILFSVSAPQAEAYNAFAGQFPLYLERDKQRFSSEIMPLGGGRCYALEENAGYILFSVQNGVFQGYECAWRDTDALRRLLGFIYTQTNAESFCLRVPADGTVRKLLCDTSVFENRRLHAMAKALAPVELTDSMENYINMIGWF